MVGLVTLVYAIVGTAQHGWGSGRTLLLLGVAGALLAAFIGIERRGREPLVPPATWRVRSLVSSAVVMLGATGILVGTFYLNTLYLQGVGYSAPKTGLSFLPLALIIFAAAHLASHLLSHAGSRVVALVGLALTAGGALLLAAAPDKASYASDILPGFLVLGAGVGLALRDRDGHRDGRRIPRTGRARLRDHDHRARARRRPRRGRPGGGRHN